MIDIKIGDKVVGIKGATRVTGTVMNIKEGHVHIKAPVSGVYAPLVSIVPLHKVTKLGEGAMKRKAEAEDDRGMSDYMHDAQTSSSAPFDDAKPAKPHQDKFGNKIKIGNVARNLAKQGMSGVKKEEVELDEDLNYRRVYEPTSAQALNPGLRAKIDAASDAQKPRPLSRMRPIGKIKLMTREEVELDEEFINGREYASHGLMHPKHAMQAIHQPSDRFVDFYASGTGDKMMGKVKSNDGKSVHIQAHPKLGDGKLHKFKVSTDLPKITNEAKDEGEYDYEGDMAMSQLKSVITNAQKLHDMLEPNTNLPEWVQSKITLAEDYIVTAANYMDGEMNEEVEQIDEIGDTPKGKAALASYITKASRQSGALHSLGKEFDNDKYMYAKKALNARTPKTKEQAKTNMETSGRLASRFTRKSYNRLANIPLAAARLAKEEVEQVEEGYKGRKAFGSAYDKTHDPFQDSKRTFKSRELEHELAHEAPSGPSHHDQTPHDVHIDGKKWKTFGSAGHAHNVANKLSISGKKASVHKTPIAEKAPPGWEGTVKAMKKHSEIDNPFALAWWMKRQGAKSHKGEK